MCFRVKFSTVFIYTFAAHDSVFSVSLIYSMYKPPRFWHHFETTMMFWHHFYSSHVCDFSPHRHVFSSTLILSWSCLFVNSSSSCFCNQIRYFSRFSLKIFHHHSLCVSPNSVSSPTPLCFSFFLSFWKRSELMSGHPFNLVSASWCEKPPLAVPVSLCVCVTNKCVSGALLAWARGLSQV